MGARKHWTCTVEGCDTKHHAKGLCRVHYRRMKKYKTIDLVEINKITTRQRFNSSYTPEPMSGCWLWEGYCNKQGYGRISINSRLVSAHRLSWELHRGPIPNGLLVLHHCDVPACVNPDHLFLGTYQDNHDDSKKKGRRKYISGEEHYNTTLTWKDVYKIRELRKKGMTYTDIGKQYKTHQSAIRSICINETWNECPEVEGEKEE